MMEGVGSYEEIYSETMSKEDMAHLDALGVEWRGRNIYEIQDALHLKTGESAQKILTQAAQKNSPALAEAKAGLVELFQIVFGEEEDDEQSSFLYRYDPISGTYQELMGTAKVFNANFPGSLFNLPEH